jgi:V/A-type H+-transporting ATPase subunit D
MPPDLENVSPTRMNMLALRAQAGLALQGVDLLKRKRDALVAEFLAYVKRTLEARENLAAACGQAFRFLVLVKAQEGREAVESRALAGRREIVLDIKTRNVWGVKIPEIKEMNFVRSPLERGYSPTGGSLRVEVAAREFERILSLLVEIAGIEARLRRVGAEIKKATRRVNALEQVVLPRTFAQIRFIRGTIEQREREDIFRLKRIKKKLAAKR